MDRRIPCYLRKHRRRWELTQDELAFLLGLEGRSLVSRYERGLISAARALIACEVIFRCPASELFPALYAEVKDEVMRRGKVLYEEFEGKEGRKFDAKRELLLRMAAPDEVEDDIEL